MSTLWLRLSYPPVNHRWPRLYWRLWWPLYKRQAAAKRRMRWHPDPGIVRALFRQDPPVNPGRPRGA